MMGVREKCATDEMRVREFMAAMLRSAIQTALRPRTSHVPRGGISVNRRDLAHLKRWVEDPLTGAICLSDVCRVLGYDLRRTQARLRRMVARPDRYRRITKQISSAVTAGKHRTAQDGDGQC